MREECIIIGLSLVTCDPGVNPARRHPAPFAFPRWFGFHRTMTISLKQFRLTLVVLLLLASGILMSQQRSPAPEGPRLYRVWSDANGDTHLEEIDITTKGRVLIPGVVMNFSGNTPPQGGENLHNTGARQFAVTVYGEIDVETSDGARRTCGPAT